MEATSLTACPGCLRLLRAGLGFNKLQRRSELGNTAIDVISRVRPIAWDRHRALVGLEGWAVYLSEGTHDGIAITFVVHSNAL